MSQQTFDFRSHDRLERLRAYVARSGFWFASCESQVDDAQRACGLGLLQPVDNLLSPEKRTRNSRYFYVRPQLRSQHELPVGLYRHLVEGMPC